MPTEIARGSMMQWRIAGLPEASARSKLGSGYAASYIGFGGEDRLETPLAPFNRGSLASTAQAVICGCRETNSLNAIWFLPSSTGPPREGSENVKRRA